jgi:hypothetical protein
MPIRYLVQDRFSDMIILDTAKLTGKLAAIEPSGDDTLALVQYAHELLTKGAGASFRQIEPSAPETEAPFTAFVVREAPPRFPKVYQGDDFGVISMAEKGKLLGVYEVVV